jgi:hypothetical protein
MFWRKFFTNQLLLRYQICTIFFSISYDWYAKKSWHQTHEISIPKNIANQAIKYSLMFIVSIFREEEYKKNISTVPVYNYLLDDNSTIIDVKLPKDKYLYLIKKQVGGDS